MRKRQGVWLGGLLVALGLWGCGSPKVSGKVVIEGAADASGVTLTLQGEKTQVVVTGADGTFVFEPVSNGSYALAVEATDVTEPRRVIALQVANGAPLDVGTLTLTGVGTVSGRATVQGEGSAAGTTVSVAGTGISAVTGADGAFVLRGVPAGERILVATRPGYAPTSTPVAVVRGTSAADLQLSLSQLTGRVKGQVSVPGSVDLAQGRITVAGLEGYSAPVAASGDFEAALPPGTWELYAELPLHPRQRIGRVTVSAGNLTALEPVTVSAYHHFPTRSPTASGGDAFLTEDGLHALVFHDDASARTASIADLRTGERRVFLVDSQFSSDYVMSPDGSHVAFAHGSSLSTHLSVIGVKSGRRIEVTSTAGSFFLSWLSARFNQARTHFFAVANRTLYRVHLESGAVDTFPANKGALPLSADADRWLLLNEVDTTNRTGTVSIVSAAEVTELANDVSFASATPLGQTVREGLLLQGFKATYLLARTRANAGQVQLLVFDLQAGTKRILPGTFPETVELSGSFLGDRWTFLESGGAAQLIDLRNGTLSPVPGGLRRAELVGSLQTNMNSSADRLWVSHSNGTAHELYVLPLPLPAGLPTPIATGASSFTAQWLSPTRLVAWQSGDLTRLIDVKNDQTTLHTPVSGVVVPEGYPLYSHAVVWRRPSDKAWVGLHGDSDLLVLQEDPGEAFAVDAVAGTLAGGWTAFSFRNVATGAVLTRVRANTAAAALRTFPGLQVRPGVAFRSEGALHVRRSQDGADAVLEMATGALRLVNEGPVSGHRHDGAMFGRPYIAGTAYVDSTRSTQVPILMTY